MRDPKEPWPVGGEEAVVEQAGRISRERMATYGWFFDFSAKQKKSVCILYLVFTLSGQQSLSADLSDRDTR